MRLIFFFFSAFFLLVSFFIGKDQWALLNSPDHTPYQLNDIEIHAIKVIENWERRFEQEHGRLPTAEEMRAWAASKNDQGYMSWFSVLRTDFPDEVVDTFTNAPVDGVVYKFRTREIGEIFYPSWNDDYEALLADKITFNFGSRAAELAMGWLFLLCTLLGFLLFSREALAATE